MYILNRNKKQTNKCTHKTTAKNTTILFKKRKKN